MPLPQSEGFEDRFRALERKVNDLFTSIQNRSGTVIASQGWLLQAMSAPDTPASGSVYIYASGGRLFARSTLGDVPLIPFDIPQGVPVTDPPDFTSSSSAGPTYNGAVQNMLTDLRADAAGTKIALDSLLSSLRGADLIGL